MKRDLIVTADGTDRVVTLEDHEGTFHITIDGVAHVVDGREIRPGTWSLLIAGRSYIVDLDQRRNGIHASVGASEATLQVEDALHRRLSQAAGNRANAQRGESIRAPIAGKVVKVLVAQGDQVAAGTPVIVLEAMKMENELVTEHGGAVTAIHKSAGQAVDTGDLLVELA